MSIALILISLALGVILIHRWSLLRIQGISPWWITSAFLLKVAAGVMVWFIYSQVYDIPRYDADIFKFYDDGATMARAMDEKPSMFIDLFLDRADGPLFHHYIEEMSNWERSYDLIQLNDNRTMIRMHAILHLVSGGNYHWHSLFFQFIAFIGSVLLFKGIRGLSTLEPWTFLLFLLPPSLLFWSSAPLKEALVLLPLGLVLYSLRDLDRRGVYWGTFLISLVLWLGIKPYVSLALIPGILFLILTKYSKRTTLSLFVICHSIILFILFIGQWVGSMNLIGILRLKRKDFVNVALDAGSAIEIPEFNDFWTFLLACPSALWRTYFRPGIWEMRSILDAMAALENSVYLLLLALAIIFRKKQVDARMLLFSASFLIGMGVLIGTVTPVLGASVRYRAPALPFLLLFIYLLMDRAYIRRYFMKKSSL